MVAGYPTKQTFGWTRDAIDIHYIQICILNFQLLSAEHPTQHVNGARRKTDNSTGSVYSGRIGATCPPNDRHFEIPFLGSLRVVVPGRDIASKES